MDSPVFTPYQPLPFLQPPILASQVEFDFQNQGPFLVFDKDCDQVRARLQALVDSGEYMIKDMVAELGVSPSSYRRFMAQSGHDKGSGSDAYISGLRLLVRRAENGSRGPRRPTKGKRRVYLTPAIGGVVDVSDVVLAGQDTDSVPVYETPREVRRRIGLFMRKSGVTQAAFLRALAAQFTTVNKTFQVVQLTRFRERSGVDSGISNPIFYAAYVYFEKLRIKENRPKSKHREEMEQIWSNSGGLDTSRPSLQDARLWARPNEQPCIDDYGRLNFLN